MLATPGWRSSQLLTPDPWAKEIDQHQSATEDGDPRSLRMRLGGTSPRWKSLWRRTDYLGFPVWGYHNNEIDSTAPEVLTVDYLKEIQTHGGYTRTPAYENALKGLLDVTRTPGAESSDATTPETT